MPIDPLASGLLSILAAGVAAAGTLYQHLTRRAAEAESKVRDGEREALRAEIVRLRDDLGAMGRRIDGLDTEAKSTRGQVQSQALALTEHRTEQRSLVEKIDRLERGVEGLDTKVDKILGAVIGSTRRDTR